MALLERLQIRTGETDRELLDEVIAEAKEIYVACRWPNQRNRPVEPEPEAEGLVLRMAIDIYNKIGAEGQRGHSENGISRSYSGDWVSHDLLAQIVPICGVAQ